MRVSHRNKISLAFHVLSHVLHTKGKKSDPVYSTPARAISRCWLNKDSSNWGANGDRKHLLLALGPSWPWGVCLWSAALATTFLQELGWNSLSNTHKVCGRSTPTPKQGKCKHTNKQVGLSSATAYTQTSRQMLHRCVNQNIILKTFTIESSVSLVFGKRKTKTFPTTFSLLREKIWHIHISSGNKPNTSLNSGPDATFGLPIPLLYFPHLWREDDSLGLPDCIEGLCVLGRTHCQHRQRGEKTPPSVLHCDLRMQLIK